jgi:hypothetical protein
VIALAREPSSDLPGGGFGFWLEAEAVEPRDDPAWKVASLELRVAFWRECSLYASRAWKRSRALGLDRNGRPMVSIGRKTAIARRHDVNRVTAKMPYSPMGRADEQWAPLQATGPNSRTQSLLRWKVNRRGAWYYWDYDPYTRRTWGAVLDRHRRGFVKYFRYPEPEGLERVPARDVFGFSEAEVNAIRDWMARWWAARRGEVVNRAIETPVSAPAVAATAVPGGVRVQMPVGGIVPREQRRVPAWLEAQRRQVRGTRVSEVSFVGMGGAGDKGAGVATRPIVNVRHTGPALPTSHVPTRLKPLRLPPLRADRALELEYAEAERIYLELLVRYSEMPAGPEAERFRTEQILPAFFRLQRLRRRGA